MSRKNILMFETIKICEYCHSQKCGCGANKYIQMDKIHYDRGIPFFYGGYIVWCLRDYEYRFYNIVFYRGKEVIDNIVIREYEKRSWNLEPGEDWFWKVWEMFCERNNIDD